MIVEITDIPETPWPWRASGEVAPSARSVQSPYKARRVACSESELEGYQGRTEITIHPKQSSRGSLQGRHAVDLLLPRSLVPGVGVEPTQARGPRDFKSLASTVSATPASADSTTVGPAGVGTNDRKHWSRGDGSRMMGAFKEAMSHAECPA